MNQISTTQAFYEHDLMVTAAHRYCLGRRTYIVSACVDWLKQNWHLFSDQTRKKIVQETKESINRDLAGDICDLYSWKSLIEFTEEFHG